MDVSQLKRIPLFSDVPDDALQKIAPFATTEEWPEGKEIVKEGGFSNHFYAIEEGTAKVERGGDHLADLGRGRHLRRAGPARAFRADSRPSPRPPTSA